MTVVSPPAHANGDITWACDADRRQKVPPVCRSAAWLSVVCVKFHITAWSHGSAGLVLDITRAAVGWSKSSVAREWCRCQKKKVCCAWADRILLQSETADVRLWHFYALLTSFFLSPTKYEGGKDIQLKNLNICNIIKQRSWVRADVAARFSQRVRKTLCRLCFRQRPDDGTSARCFYQQRRRCVTVPSCSSTSCHTLIIMFPHAGRATGHKPVNSYHACQKKQWWHLLKSLESIYFTFLVLTVSWKSQRLTLKSSL